MGEKKEVYFIVFRIIHLRTKVMKRGSVVRGERHCRSILKQILRNEKSR